jgi:hypothetical protein
VAFFDHLPGDIADQAGKRDEEKFLFVHERGRIPPRMSGL